MGSFLAKYATALTVEFPMIKAGTTDFAISTDWTPVTGDTKITLDGADVVNTTNTPASVGGTGSALWSLTLTAAELTGKRATVQIIDAATKLVVDNALIIETYGHASAQHPFDFGTLFATQFASAYATALTTQMVESYAALGVAPTPAQHYFMIDGVLNRFAKVDDVLTVYQLDGITVAATFQLNDATNPTTITRLT